MRQLPLIRDAAELRLFIDSRLRQHTLVASAPHLRSCWMIFCEKILRFYAVMLMDFFCFFSCFFFFWEFCGEAEGMLNGSTKGWFMLGEEWRGNENCINTCTMVEVGYRLDSLLILCNYSNWEYLDNLLGYSLLPSELYKYLGDRNWLRSWFEFVGNSLGFVEIEGGWSVMRNRNCTNIRVTVEIACCLNSLKILIRNRGDSSVVQWMARE